MTIRTKVLITIASIFTGFFHAWQVLLAKAFSWSPYRHESLLSYPNISIACCALLILAVPILIYFKEKIAIIAGLNCLLIISPWMWNFAVYLAESFLLFARLNMMQNWFETAHIFYTFILVANIFLWVILIISCFKAFRKAQDPNTEINPL